MSKKTKIFLFIGFSLILIGCIFLGGALTGMKWDFTKLSTVKYETNDYEINEAYKNISILTETADILFVTSENSKTSVVCHEHNNLKHLVSVQDGALVIEIDDTRKWYEYIGINFGTPQITVYIPQGEYGALMVKSNTGDVEISKELKFESIDILESTGNVTNYASALDYIKIKTTTGNICVENVSANIIDLSVSTGAIDISKITCDGDVKINVSTGKANLTDINCKNIISCGSTGDISIKNVIAAEKLTITRSTGDIKFESCDAAEIFVKTDTGDVTGNLLTEKVFITQTDTGNVDVPKSVSGGKCEIITDTGDIKINIQ